jgi:hypothetical protein
MGPHHADLGATGAAPHSEPMRLPVGLCRLPIRFDVGRLVREVMSVRPEEWIDHPAVLEPCRNAILISVRGSGNNDFAASGQMRATPLLNRCPYVLQVLAALNTPISRARFAAIAGPARLALHEDANYHWFNRTRIHIPVITSPLVRFTVENKAEHLAPGETWILDNFRMHAVDNPTSITRIHLIADTIGSPAFWRMMRSSIRHGFDVKPRFVPFDRSDRPRLQIERMSFSVPSAKEMNGLVRDIVTELPTWIADETKRQTIEDQLIELRKSWREQFAKYGCSRRGEHAYRRLLDGFAAVSSGTGLKQLMPKSSKAYSAAAVLSSVFQANNNAA